MKIAIVGTGYQGLVVGACLAENGHHVRCIDQEEARVAELHTGKLPLYEPGLEELVARNLEEERLSFSTDLVAGVAESLMVFLCVDTPLREDGEADITGVLKAVGAIGEVMDGYRIIVNKSTCPPGTAEAFERILAEKTTQSWDVVVNPDFLKEGNAIDDFMRPDRIVIGCEDVRVREIMKELYSPFLRTGRPCLCMKQRSAEMTKYATNVMLAARISLMNQLADICEVHGADIGEVREGVAFDERIGAKFLFPGLGFGGFGMPKDLITCSRLAREKDQECDLIDAVANVNQRRRHRFLTRILEYYGEGIADKTIAFWGASFKPRTDDLRGAPAITLLEGLLEAGAGIRVFDPVAAPRLSERYGDGLAFAKKYYEALEGVDGLVICTEWNEFRRPDYERMGQLMREKVIFDGRNLYTPKVMQQAGFRYFSVGRPAV